MMNDTEQLNQLIRERYNVLDDIETPVIHQNQLAEAVLKFIDPGSISPALVRHAAVLELRQLARAICRARYEENQKQHEVEQSGDLFDFELQPRYPAQRDGDEAYVLRLHLTIDERRENSARLRSEAKTKLRHANALDAETDDLIRKGVLVVPSQSIPDSEHPSV